MTLKIAIIILNWENASATQQCARSVLDEMKRCSDDANSHLWIIDNGSGDNSKTSLKAWADSCEEDVSFIANPENFGFSKGMNKGIFAAFDTGDFDFFWLLNNDVTVEAGSLKSLLLSAAEDPGVAIWGSTVIDAASGMVQCAGGCQYNRWIGKETAVYSGLEPSEIPFQNPPNLDYIYGAAMFISGALLERLQGLNEDYFLFFEELDLVNKMEPGEKIGWCVDSIVVHQGGGSSSSKFIRTFTAYHAALSAFRYTRQYCPMCLPTVFMARALGLAFYAVRYQNPKLAFAPWRALKDLFSSHT